LAENTAEVATPLALVVAVFAPPAKVPLAPVAGAANVTTTPLTAVVPCITVATNGAPNAVLIITVCGVPLVAAMVSVFLLPDPLHPAIPIDKTTARVLQ
jgi:hypothetical protein